MWVNEHRMRRSWAEAPDVELGDQELEMQSSRRPGRGGIPGGSRRNSSNEPELPLEWP